ncbi:tyrosine-type recombinase/integrase [Waltera intestinalis]|uniref:Tyrosine-type recombinase/integrase n=1 Tax=Waltera intestinalis TaxID=2606635 RepID=A0A6L5YGD3_9FIRM|nr:tyrosine-type recombinase/integrase [Waltera intestinalis]MST57279.1 tyrosine-type recombinase/integrase [Waltera intestinalis]
MTKTDLINDIAFEMSNILTPEQIDKVKIVFLVKMQDYEISEIKQLPMVEEHDNEWLMQRYCVDGVAAGRHKSTLRSYIGIIRKFFDHVGKNYKYVTAQDITDYLAIRSYRDHISHNYKSTIYRYLCTFFSWAFRKQHIANNIIDGVDRVKQVKKKKVRLTDEEVETIRYALQTPKEKALFELMICTGMRVGEISYLNVSDIDLTNKQVSIYAEKTDTYRTGMLTPVAVMALRNYIGDRPGTDPLFLADRAPHNRMREYGIEKLAKEMAVRGGVSRITATVHVYRKTFASVLYRKTGDVLLVSKLLGHAKPDMTVQYYLIDDIEEMQHKYNRVA